MPHMYWRVARPLTVCPFENLKFTNNILKGFGSRIISKLIYINVNPSTIFPKLHGLITYEDRIQKNISVFFEMSTKFDEKADLLFKKSQGRCVT